MTIERWADSNTSLEHEKFVSFVEKQLEDLVTKEKLTEAQAQKVIQRVEAYQRNFDSIEDAQEKAKYFIEMIVMPIVFSLDYFKEKELEIATMQGLIQLEREEIVERLGEESDLLPRLDEIDERLDSWGADIKEERINLLT